MVTLYRTAWELHRPHLFLHLHGVSLDLLTNDSEQCAQFVALCCFSLVIFFYIGLTHFLVFVHPISLWCGLTDLLEAFYVTVIIFNENNSEPLDIYS